MHLQRRVVFAAFVLVMTLGIPPSAADENTHARANLGLCSLHTTFTNVVVADGSCAVFQTAPLPPGAILSIQLDVQATLPWDLFVLDQVTWDQYNGSQDFSSVLVDGPSLINVQPTSLSFNWTTPTSCTGQSTCIWHLILDNRNDAKVPGAPGGAPITASLSVIERTNSPNIIYDSVGHYGADKPHPIVTQIGLDSGSTIQVEAKALVGTADIYLLTDEEICSRTAVNYPEKSCWWIYQNINDQGDLWIPGASAPDRTYLWRLTPQLSSLTWTVDSTHDGMSILVVVNTQARGDSGLATAASGTLYIRVSINPVINAEGLVGPNGASSEVGGVMTLDSSTTPNASAQIIDRWWDLDINFENDGFGGPANDRDCDANSPSTTWEVIGSGASLIGECRRDGNEMSNEVRWLSPGSRTIALWVKGSDGTLDSHTIPVTITDQTDPILIGSINGITQPSVGDRKEYSATVDDNHQPDEYRWLINGNIRANGSLGAANMDEFGRWSIPQFSETWNSRGIHSLRLEVSDPSGNLLIEELKITVIDTTIPEIRSLEASATKVEVGATITLEASASEIESPSGDIVYCWDLNTGIDSSNDSDPSNDCDVMGQTVEVSWSTPGSRDVVLIARNVDGYSAYEVLAIEILPLPESDFPIFSVILLVSTLAAVGGWLGWRRYNDVNTLKEMMAQQVAESSAQQTQELDSASQVSMFAPTSNEGEMRRLAGIGGGSFSRDAAEAEMARLAGMPVYSHSIVEPVQNPVDIEDIKGIKEMDELSFLDATSPKNTSPTLIDDFDPYGSPDQIDPLAVEAYSSHRAECANCSRTFALDLPPNTKEAVVECPHCNTRQRFRP